MIRLDNLIIGGGLSGLAKGEVLRKNKKNYMILEATGKPGGLCTTTYINGFKFDKTGHFLYFRDNQVRNFIEQDLKIKLNGHRRRSGIIFKDKIIPYPFQLNLWALPDNVKKQCVKGVFQVNKKIIKSGGKIKKPRNFRDWSYACFGKGISDNFMIPYNKKLWTIPLNRLTLEWLGDFVPKPDYAEILKSAVEKPGRKIGYNPYFYYPDESGIQLIVDILAQKNKKSLRLNSRVTEINLRSKVVTAGKDKFKFKNLYSTIPLPELINVIKDAPENIVAQNKNLDYISVMYFNIGFKEKPPHKKHWLYFPNPKYKFYRVGFYNNISRKLAPPNTTSVYIEMSYHGKLGISFDNILKTTIGQLEKLKLVPEDSTIIAMEIGEIKYAYVLFTRKNNKAKNIINRFLEKNKIQTLGRYANWEYSSMEKSIRDAL